MLTLPNIFTFTSSSTYIFHYQHLGSLYIVHLHTLVNSELFLNIFARFQHYFIYREYRKYLFVEITNLFLNNSLSSAIITYNLKRLTHWYFLTVICMFLEHYRKCQIWKIGKFMQGDSFRRYFSKLVYFYDYFNVNSLNYLIYASV